MRYEPNDRVMLMKGDCSEVWKNIGNPRWRLSVFSMSDILRNDFNEYSEYYSSGCKTRMIRFRDVEKYGLDPDQVVALRLSEMPVAPR